MSNRMLIICAAILILVIWVTGWVYALDKTGQEFPLTSALRKLLS